MAYLKTQTDDRGVTTMTLNRPEQRNAIDRAFMDEFSITLDKLGSNTRVLLLDAVGEHFCAGADISWMKNSINLSDEENHADAMALSNMLDKLDRFPKPTLARVTGAALGGGTGLICYCDIVIADESARFGFTEVKLGLIPATISPYAIAAIGTRAARRYFLSGEHIDAVDAYRIGLIHDICSKDNMDIRVEEKITALLQCSPSAQSACKQLIKAVNGKTVDNELRQQLGKRLADTRAGHDAQEGLGAFIDKRRPNWTSV